MPRHRLRADRIFRDGYGCAVNGDELPLELLCIVLPEFRKLERSWVQTPALLRNRHARIKIPYLLHGLLRRAACRDDLIGGPPGQFRHVVEFEDE